MNFWQHSLVGSLNVLEAVWCAVFIAALLVCIWALRESWRDYSALMDAVDLGLVRPAYLKQEVIASRAAARRDLMSALACTSFLVPGILAAFLYPSDATPITYLVSVSGLIGGGVLMLVNKTLDTIDRHRAHAASPRRKRKEP